MVSSIGKTMIRSFCSPEFSCISFATIFYWRFPALTLASYLKTSLFSLFENFSQNILKNLFYFTKEHNLTSVPFFWKQYKVVRNDMVIGSHFLRMKFCNTCLILLFSERKKFCLFRFCLSPSSELALRDLRELRREVWSSLSVGWNLHWQKKLSVSNLLLFYVKINKELVYFSYFYEFLGSTSFFSVFIFSCAIAMVKLSAYGEMQATKDANQSFLDFLEEHPMAFFLGVYSFLFFLFTGALLVYHTYLIFTNQTTNEELKKMWHVRSNNPFKRSKTVNFCVFWVFITETGKRICCSVVGSKRPKSFSNSTKLRKKKLGIIMRKTLI